VLAAAAGNRPRGLAALDAAALSAGLLTATMAPTAGGRDNHPAATAAGGLTGLYTEPA
jgi:hypothetical protein